MRKQKRTTEKKYENFIYVPKLGKLVSKNPLVYEEDWEQAKKKLEDCGLKMITLDEYTIFFKYLLDTAGAIGGNYEGNIKNREHKNIIDTYMFTYQCNPLTKINEDLYLNKEWIDARFENKKGGMYIHNRGNVEKLTGNYYKDWFSDSEPLSNWLYNHTKQGLPKPGPSFKKEIDSFGWNKGRRWHNQTFRYEPPQDSRVALYTAKAEAEYYYAFGIKGALFCDINYKRQLSLNHPKKSNEKVGARGVII